MFDMIFEYLDTLIDSGRDFLILLAPLGVVYIIFRSFRTIYRDGDLLWVIVDMVFTFSGMGLGVYTYTQGGPFWLMLLISFVGVALSVRIGERFMPKKKDDHED